MKRKVLTIAPALLSVLAFVTLGMAEEAKAPSQATASDKPAVSAPAPATAAAPAKATKKDYQAFDLGELYVTGEKPPVAQQVTEITEITAEEIEATHSRTIAEALSHAPGITVTTGRKGAPTVNIHGINQNKTLVLIDGVPYYETTYGSLNLDSIPTDNVAKIEIQKGVSSVLYGPNALAGVINIITKKGTERPAIGALAEIGDYETNRFTFWNGMKAGIFNYWVSYDRQESRGWYMSRDYDPRWTRVNYKNPSPKPPTNPSYILEDGGVRDNSYSKLESIWAKVGIEPTPDSEYYANFHYITQDKGGPASIMDDSNRIFLSRPAFSQFWQIPRYDNWGIDLSGRQNVGNRITMKGKLFYHSHIDDLTSYKNPDYSGYLSISRYRDSLAGGSFVTDFKASDIDTLKFAVNWRRDKHEERADNYLPFQEAISTTASLGLENELILFKNLSIVAGLSYDWWYVLSSTQNVTNKKGDFTGVKYLDKPDTNRLDPMIGATYTFCDGTKLFASWAKKIRFPTLTSLYSSTSGNPNLKPEKSDNYILGVSRGVTKYAKAEASFFSYDIKDMISRDGSSTTSQYMNYGEVLMYGFEVTTEIYPTKDLTFKAGYTYNNATDKSSPRITDRVTFVPTHKADFNLKYNVPVVDVKFDLNALYVGRIWGQLPTVASPKQAALRTGDYFIVDMRISREIMKNLEGYFVATNILDKDYEQEVGFPAPGRNLFVGLKMSY